MLYALPDTLLYALLYALFPGVHFKCRHYAVFFALALNPKFLVLDEITSNLDVITTNNIIELLRDLNSENNTTMLFITHDLALADKFCSRKIVMKEGKKVEEVKKLRLDHVSDEYTKELINSSF